MMLLLCMQQDQKIVYIYLSECVVEHFPLYINYEITSSNERRYKINKRWSNDLSVLFLIEKFTYHFHRRHGKKINFLVIIT